MRNTRLDNLTRDDAGHVTGLQSRRADGRLPIVIYDGHCGMCRGQVRNVRRTDWLRRLGDERYDAAVQRFPEVARGTLGDGMRVRFPDGTATVGIDAVRSIMMRTPLGFLPGLLLHVPGIRRLGARLYARISARRATAACDDACAVPQVPADQTGATD